MATSNQQRQHTFTLKAGGRLSQSDESQDAAGKVQIDFTLQQLIEHFTIPDGPDVATLNPELHQRNLALPHEIEEIIAL